MDKYINRIVDKEIKDKLSIMGAVLIRGPKWCGKTTSATQIAKSVLEMQNPDEEDNNIELASLKPSLLLEGDKPRLIDEWQIAPKIWNAVRYSVDKIGKPGQYILTGSATPIGDKTLHSGAGRFAFITMKPMTLYESGDSNGKISLKSLFDGKQNIDGIKASLTYEKIAYLICRGGWPSAINMKEESSLEISKNYIEAVVNSDISNIDGVTRNPNLAREILKSYSRNISTISTESAIYEDVRANFSDVSSKTISEYLNQLKKLYIIDEIEAWSPNIRSKTTIRTSNKKSMIDPSLATASLECTPKSLMLDPNTMGLLFENLVSRDLSVYASVIDGRLSHYRDRYGLECDNVIHLNDGRYALVEIKLGDNHLEEAKNHLLKLKGLIAENPKLDSPTFMMIITGTNKYAYVDNGILIVPIGCLKD